MEKDATGRFSFKLICSSDKKIKKAESKSI